MNAAFIQLLDHTKLEHFPVVNTSSLASNATARLPACNSIELHRLSVSVDKNSIQLFSLVSISRDP